jgi:hypothetical protein
MKSHEVIRNACRNAGPKIVASKLGVSLPLLYKWMQPDTDEKSSGARNPLDRLALLYRLTGDPALVSWVCRQANGYFIENSDTKPQPEELYPAMNMLLQELAEMLSTLARAGEDHVITPKEASHLRIQWDRLQAVCEGFVKECERGNYDKVESQMHDLELPKLLKSA